jgi:hypothetical protein
MLKKTKHDNEEACRFVVQAIAITSTCTSFFMLVCPHLLCFVHKKAAVVVTEPMTMCMKMKVATADVA